MAVTTYPKTIVGVFNSVQDAQRAVETLQREGISRDDISVVANKNAAGYETMTDSDKASNVVADAGIGAAIGGVGGLLLSAVGAITIPVIGPILAAGPIAAALTGAGIGAAAGGLIGALTESGIPEEHARTYAEGVRRGDVLVTVKTDQAHSDRVCDILDNNDAVDVDERVSNWQQRGWTGFSPEAKPLTAEELRNERSYYTSRSSLDRPGSPADMDADGDANAMERGAYKTKEGLKDAGDKVKEWGHDAANAMRKTGDKIQETGRDLRDESRETGRRMSETEAERRRRARIYDRTL